jgi:hypothetical protein
MIDENAFGILISDYDIEEDEYELEREVFVQRIRRFRDAVFDHVASQLLANDARALDMGHAVYFEFGDGEQVMNPVAWLRDLRNAVAAQGLMSCGVLSHGSRWVDEEHGVELEAEQRFVGSVALVRFSHPSEALRRALYADTASRPVDAPAGEQAESWGPGLYVDTEAIEALGLALKNQPTPLHIAGASFFRVGR